VYSSAAPLPPRLRISLAQPDLDAYLQQNIDYYLDAENLQGLQRFFALSAAAKITGPVEPIALARHPDTLKPASSNLSEP
jgi:hypothetical protein